MRKHAGKQKAGWQFDLRHLYRKSGCTARFSDFACNLRAVVARQSLPGYILSIQQLSGEQEILIFRPVPPTARG